MDVETPKSLRIKRSKLITLAAVLLLLPGLLFSLGVISNTIKLMQGPPRGINPIMREPLEGYITSYRVGALIHDSVWVILLLPAALTLFRRWRYARIHSTIAVLGSLAILGWGWFFLQTNKPFNSGQLIVAALWLTWAIFILISIWRRSVTREFSITADKT